MGLFYCEPAQLAKQSPPSFYSPRCADASRDETQLAKQSPASFYSPRCTDAFRYETRWRSNPPLPSTHPDVLMHSAMKTQLATHSPASFYNLRYAHALSYETHTNVLPLAFYPRSIRVPARLKVSENSTSTLTASSFHLVNGMPAA